MSKKQVEKKVPKVALKTNKDDKMSIAFKISIYESKVKEYQKKLGLLNWEINIDEIEDDSCRGCIQYDTEAKLAIVFYDISWINQIDLLKEEIELVAFHEMSELLLAEIHDFIVKHSNEEQANSMCHSVIRLLENIILKNLN